MRCLSKVLLQALAHDIQQPPIEVSINFMRVVKKASILANIAVAHHLQFKVLLQALARDTRWPPTKANIVLHFNNKEVKNENFTQYCFANC